MAANSLTQHIDQTQLTPGNEVTASLTRHFHGRVTVRRVLEVTARHYGVTVPEMLTRGRKRRAVRRRQVAAYIARRHTGRSLPVIADRMGGWHHTTVLHSIRSVEGRIAAGHAKTAAAVNAIVAQVMGGAHE